MIKPEEFTARLSVAPDLSLLERDIERAIDDAIARATEQVVTVPSERLPEIGLPPGSLGRALRSVGDRYRTAGWLVAIGPRSVMAVLAPAEHRALFEAEAGRLALSILD